MNIVILDGYTLNPGDLSWEPLKKHGTLSVYDRTPAELILERASGADIVFTNKTLLTAATLDQLPELRYIGVLATGYDVVDIETAQKHNIVVTNVPAYGVDSVAQMVFAHILNITNNVAGHAQDVRCGGWSTQKDFCYLLSPQIELTDKVLGIVGYGDIGKATARLAQAFKMKVLIHTRTPPNKLSPTERLVDLETLFRESDIISLHCPLTAKTKHMINVSSLQLMKKSAILINCSRGPLVDEDAISQALLNERLLAAGLDVLQSEPPDQLSPLFELKNCYITPHIAWATREARSRLLDIAIDNLCGYLDGELRNCVT